jgi:hypothetical protein
VSTATPYESGPGCFAQTGLPADIYRAQPGLTQSDINRFAESPALFRYVEREQTAAMQTGTALHALMLEGRREFVVRPATYGPESKPWHGGAKECKEWSAAHAGQTILSAGEADALERAANHARQHERVAYLLDGAQTELSVFGAGRTGLTWGKGRLDAVKHAGDRLLITDIKTTNDARLRPFSQTILQRGYHRQAAWYRRLMRQFMDEKIRIEFWFVAVEIEPLPRCNVWKLEDAAMDLGDEEIDKLIEKLDECRQTGRWPDYHDKDVGLMGTIDLPRWCYGDETALEGLTKGTTA